MKKFLFLISCLLVFGLTGCKKDVERQSYSVTITNNCSVDILVNVGYVEYDKKTGYDWDHASYYAFKEYMQLGPGEIAVVSGSRGLRCAGSAPTARRRFRRGISSLRRSAAASSSRHSCGCGLRLRRCGSR